jgi:hypothetical protein
LEILVNEFVLGHVKAELSVFEQRISQVVIGKEQFFFQIFLGGVSLERFAGFPPHFERLPPSELCEKF